MYKSPRLINEIIDNQLEYGKILKKYDVETSREAKEYCNGHSRGLETCKMSLEVCAGDIMTGFEIIASLPLEEQRDLRWGHVPDAFSIVSEQEYDKIGSKGSGCITALQQRYKWNGESWEIYDGE